MEHVIKISRGGHVYLDGIEVGLASNMQSLSALSATPGLHVDCQGAACYLSSDSVMKWESYVVETVSFHFKESKLHAVSLNLAPSDEDLSLGVLKSNIVTIITQICGLAPQIGGKSTACFRCDWGEVEVVHDVKISATSVILRYA